MSNSEGYLTYYIWHSRRAIWCWVWKFELTIIMQRYWHIICHFYVIILVIIYIHVVEKMTLCRDVKNMTLCRDVVIIYHLLICCTCVHITCYYLAYLSRDVVIFNDVMCTCCDPYHVMYRCCHKWSRNSDISYVSISALEWSIWYSIAGSKLPRSILSVPCRPAFVQAESVWHSGNIQKWDFRYHQETPWITSGELERCGNPYEYLPCNHSRLDHIRLLCAHSIYAATSTLIYR